MEKNLIHIDHPTISKTECIFTLIDIREKSKRKEPYDALSITYLPIRLYVI